MNLQPVTDPWFYADSPSGQISYFYDQDNMTVYYADEPASPLACVQQQQFCAPDGSSNGSSCTSLGGMLDVADELYREVYPDLSAKLYWAYSAVFLNDLSIGGIITLLSAGALLAEDTIADGLQAPLPDGQWRDG